MTAPLYEMTFIKLAGYIFMLYGKVLPVGVVVGFLSGTTTSHFAPFTPQMQTNPSSDSLSSSQRPR